MESSYILEEYKWWSHDVDSMEIPWNAKHSSDMILWSYSWAQIQSKIMICAPRCSPQHYYHSQDIESTKTTIDRETKTTASIFSQEYYSALEQNN